MARLNHTNGREQFVLCVENESNPESLEVRTVYRVLPDAEGLRHKLIRVIDESGEDYLYPQDYFVRIELPQPRASVSPRPGNELDVSP